MNEMKTQGQGPLCQPDNPLVLLWLHQDQWLFLELWESPNKATAEVPTALHRATGDASFWLALSWKGHLHKYGGALWGDLGKDADLQRGGSDSHFVLCGSLCLCWWLATKEVCVTIKGNWVWFPLPPRRECSSLSLDDFSRYLGEKVHLDDSASQIPNLVGSLDL